MVIVNTSKNTIVAEGEVVRRTLVGTCLGLMLRKKPQSMVLCFSKEGRYSLHMCFVFFAIDVLFLSAEKKVVEIREDFRPWSLYSPKKMAKFIIEVPQGEVSRSRTEVGDVLDFTQGDNL